MFTILALNLFVLTLFSPVLALMGHFFNSLNKNQKGPDSLDAF